jgi:hypothetical protein
LYFAFLHPAFSVGKLKSENMVMLVQILHEFVTTASVYFQYVTVGNIVTLVQLTVLGQKGRPGEWIKYAWTLQSGRVLSLFYLTTINCHVLLAWLLY